MIEKRLNKNGKVSYRVRVATSNGKFETATFPNITLAKKWEQNKKSESLKNKALGIAPLKDNIKLADFIDVWMKTKIIPMREPKTVADYWTMANLHFKKEFGSIPIRSFERSHADKLIQNLKALGRSPKTINKILALFKQIFLFAEADGYLSQSPYRHFSRLKVTTGRIDFLSTQEILQLLRANATESISPLLVLALNTGMRIGELTGLCWSRINFEMDFIEVSQTQTRSGLKNTTKTHLVRHIPMNMEVKKTLFELMRKQKCPQYVFVKANGEPYNPDHFTKRYFEKALERAGVRRVTFHVLRHTYASQFMMKGGNIYDLQKILGHTNVTMTMKYAHLSPQHLRKAMDTVRFSTEGDNSGITEAG